MSNQNEKSGFSKKSSGVVLKDVTKIFQQPDTGKDFVAVNHIDLEIKVDGSKSLWESHAIAERVHAGVEQNFPDIKHIMIHVNPASLPAAPD